MRSSISKICDQMQKDASPEASSGNTSANINHMSHSSPFDSYTSLSPQLDNHHNQFYAANFNMMYPSIFPPKSSLPTSLSDSVTPSSDDHITSRTNAIATENRLYQARLILERQQLRDRYYLCGARLQDILQESESLRQENAELQLANKELTDQLSLLSKSRVQKCLLSSGIPNLLDDFNRLSIGGLHERRVTEEVSDFSPTSVIEPNRFETRNVERVTIPKSISVRSSGYLKLNHPGGNNGGPSRTLSHQRVSNPVNVTQHRVYVPGSKREEEALELEVYNQGMFKTELCNKWQETGACPYGKNCRFAHGITELRPIIRHPRYKTEVCRLVLTNGTCPYGHRCHFRHSLTDQERLLGLP